MSPRWGSEGWVICGGYKHVAPLGLNNKWIDDENHNLLECHGRIARYRCKVCVCNPVICEKNRGKTFLVFEPKTDSIGRNRISIPQVEQMDCCYFDVCCFDYFA
jgi:hypothetical protein